MRLVPREGSRVGAILASRPPRALNNQKQLAESGRMHSDLSIGFEVDGVHVGATTFVPPSTDDDATLSNSEIGSASSGVNSTTRIGSAT